MSAAKVDSLSWIMDSLGQSTIGLEALDRIGTLSDQQCVAGLNAGLAELLLSFFHREPRDVEPTSVVPPRRVLEALACAFLVYLVRIHPFPTPQALFLVPPWVDRPGKKYWLRLHLPSICRQPRSVEKDGIHPPTKAGIDEALL